MTTTVPINLTIKAEATVRQTYVRVVQTGRESSWTILPAYPGAEPTKLANLGDVLFRLGLDGYIYCDSFNDGKELLFRKAATDG